MNHVLVTGAGGYIGCILVDELLSEGYRVTAVDRYFFGEDVFQKYNSNPRFQQRKTDIRDLRPQDFEGVNTVCDLAALSNDPSADLDPQLTESVNFAGRLHVAKCAREAGVERYVLSSSCSIYGISADEDLDETTPARPLTAYAKASLKAEQHTRELMHEKFTWTAVRNATVFGLSRRMRFDLVINLMTLNAVQKGKIFILGGGRQWRPLVHVRDVARAFICIIKAPREKVHGQLFNVGLANYQVLSLAYIVRETLPFPIEVEIAPDDSDKRNYKVSFQRLRTTLGYGPRVTIPEGIREIYEAMKAGEVVPSPETSTVGWYQTLLDAERLINRVKLNGRLL
jgi:nucleoside-diphosphate-sugar epimerase